MDNKTKIILTAIGLSAVVVPAIFLFLMSQAKTSQQNPQTDFGGRQINKANIEKEVKSNQTQPNVAPSPSVTLSPTPLPSPKESTTSAF